MSASLSPRANLSAMNTLGLTAYASRILHLQSIEQLEKWRLDPELNALPWLILGGGSNLVLSESLDSVVVHVELKGKRLLREDNEAWYVAAAAGELWHPFVQWTLAQGWGGLENLSLIPGTVGAAPVQNIGAYGVELKDTLDHLTAIDLSSGQMQQFSAAQCQFAYRDSFFKQSTTPWLICEVVFRLPKNHQTKTNYGDIANALQVMQLSATPSAVSQAICQVRQAKLPDPAVIGNAGSYFKNPIVSAAHYQKLQARYPQLVAYALADGQYKLAAGWLIEQAGWKGRRLGPVGMYEKQALVLVNHGGATAADVLALEQAVQADIAALFELALESEPVKW
ncbi:UDP-N-acetylmuramate dehydrogenase [Deefgea sp. CFH1-16]|uniref:UDP-N-acetylmuramate dehydrogenase n=1 Tax=Deefgea sp. CFH1-16 TaxID=2675457 RepID=UPI0015F3B6F6|nr:UDP-N-acetylmuramate dehydrogenase [Deefgea sp. CFH1-16]MBM5573343.1 UDP-N-acetylmuramate dehydrogenase [Deefgea sp. CFH1-16]